VNTAAAGCSTDGASGDDVVGKASQWIGLNQWNMLVSSGVINHINAAGMEQALQQALVRSVAEHGLQPNGWGKVSTELLMDGVKTGLTELQEDEMTWLQKQNLATELRTDGTTCPCDTDASTGNAWTKKLGQGWYGIAAKQFLDDNRAKRINTSSTTRDLFDRGNLQNWNTRGLEIFHDPATTAAAQRRNGQQDLIDISNKRLKGLWCVNGHAIDIATPEVRRIIKEELNRMCAGKPECGGKLNTRRACTVDRNAGQSGTRLVLKTE